MVLPVMVRTLPSITIRTACSAARTGSLISASGAELAAHELPVVGVDAVGEALGRHPHPGHRARLAIVPGLGHGHQDQVAVELQHLLGGGAPQREILLEHVVLDAVGLDVLEPGAGGAAEGVEGADLVAMVVLQLVGA